MFYDYIVIAVYFVSILAIGIIFSNMASKSTSDYFRGGGKMLWWMVGSTAFMAQFSAVTFTGAAGKAYVDGFAICAIFLGNTFAFYCGWKFFAYRFRQMRVDTPTQGIRRRYGPGNELFFSCVIIALSFILAGVWLNALAVFTSAVFGSDLVLTTIAIGMTVLFVSVLSGAWGVVASDFVQTLVVVVVSVACAIVALVKVGGPVNLVTDFPGNFFLGPNMNYPVILIGTFLFFLPKQTISIMNIDQSFRYLNAKDSVSARKGTFFAMILLGLGSFVWFIPAWATASLYPDAVAGYSQLGNKAADAVYLEFARRAMPVGTVGILMAGLFAATMSSMDSALNKNSGIVVRSIYEPYMAKRNRVIDDNKLLGISKLVSLVCGAIVIGMALYFASYKELSIYELMISVSTLVQAPLMVPLCLGMFIKKTPQWAPWATVAVGLFVSWFVINVMTADVVTSWFGIESLTNRETVDMNIILTVIGQVFITGGFFWATKLFYNETADRNRVESEKFFEDMYIPVVADEQDDVDRQQRQKLGNMAIVMSLGVLCMTLIPNPVWGRLMFAVCAGVILLIGLSLHRSAGSLT